MEIMRPDQIWEGMYLKGKIDRGEYRRFFENRVMLKFGSLREATVFAYRFVHEHLIPRYGLEEARRFPMTKSDPSKDFGIAFDEVIGLRKPDLIEETWLLVPEDRFAEVEGYLSRKQ